MDTARPDTRVAIRTREWQWLTTETEAWVREGLIEPGQRERLVARYAIDGSAGRRRAFVALTSLAVLVASVAVLLVIGYNWDAIPRAAKVSAIFGAVAATFGASAIAYARGRTTAGELTAFAGTLLYGNAIWLLAQVYQIRSHYPNGALWWMIGALVTAHLLRSRIIAFEAVILSAMWLVMELSAVEQVNYLYVPFAALTIWLAYRVQSAGVLALSTVVLSGWMFAMAGQQWTNSVLTWNAVGWRVAVAIGAMTGSALYTVSFLHKGTDRLRGIWEGTGLAVLGFFLTLLMTHGVHRAVRATPPIDAQQLLLIWPVLVLAGTLACVAVVATIRRPEEAGRGWPVLATLGLAVLWMAMVLFADDAWRSSWFSWAMTIGFSAAAVALGVTLIHRAIRENRGWLFALGIGYIIMFLIVRWIDLLHSMLWSALFLGVTAVTLFLLARMWLSRRPASSTGVH